MSVRRTTIELDEELLATAKRVLGQTTTRSTVEEALRRAIAGATNDRAEQAARQRAYLHELAGWADREVLASDEMWR